MREKIATIASQANRINLRANESLTADRVITYAEIDQFQGFTFTPTAARNVDLPAEEACKGVYIFINNKAGGAYALTVRNDAAATVGTVSQNQVGLFLCDGSAWFEITS